MVQSERDINVADAARVGHRNRNFRRGNIRQWNRDIARAVIDWRKNPGRQANLQVKGSEHGTQAAIDSQFDC